MQGQELYQEQYEEPQYNEEELVYEEQQQEEPYYEQEQDYQYEEQNTQEQDIYDQPRIEFKTFQPHFYSLEERKALLQTARPMFTVLSYANNGINTLGTNNYNKNTEPIKNIAKTNIINDQKKEDKKENERKKEVMKSNKNLEGASRYRRRDANKVIKKKEKIRQSSVNKNDRGKRHHLTYEVINVVVEKEV